jgi:voltage-gated potassium channel
MSVILVWWFLGAVLIHYFERAQGWSLFESFYFILITTATIGFWDFVPKTTEWRVMTMLYAIFYVPIFIHALATLFESRYRKLREAERLFEETMRRAEDSVENILRK